MKTHTLKRRVKYFIGALIILYPLLVFSALVIFKLNIRYLSLLLIVLSIAYIFINRQNYHGRHPVFILISPAILFTIGSLCFTLPFFIDSDYLYKILLKIYPAMASIVFFIIMGTSIFIPPNLVYTMVNLFDKDLKINVDAGYYARYCHRCAIAWCLFFIVDAVISLITSFKASDLIWAIYNSGITYIIMALIFVVQYVNIKMIEHYVVNIIQKRPDEILEEKK